ncbi:MAG: hypothetical protein JNL10_14915 [Verrucomicrobiales bacterium]|nr:hypothetical protein [Verrucomicrobiales bacterium]
MNSWLRTLAVASVLGVLAGMMRSWAGGPAGDAKAEPIVVVGSSWRMTVDNTRATSEGAEEPTRGDWSPIRLLPEHSLWFSWTAPKDGRAMWLANRLDRGIASGPASVTGVYVIAYTNNRAGVPGLYARSDRPLSRSAAVSFVVKAGTTYRLLLDTVGNTFGGFDVAVNYTDPAPPSNDEPATAVDLRESDGWVVFDLNGATKGTGDADFGKHLTSVPPIDPSKPWTWSVTEVPRGGNSVWFTWRAGKSGVMDLNVTLPSSYPQLAVYREKAEPRDPKSLPELEEILRITNGVVHYRTVKYEDVFSGEITWRWEETSFQGIHELQSSLQVEAGDRFLFLVDQMVSVESAPFRPLTYPSRLDPAENGVGFLRVSERLPNDDLAGAIAVKPGKPVIAWGSSTLEANEARLAGGNGPGSWWWHWTSDRAETVAVVPPTARVFVGSDWTSLLEVLTDVSAAEPSCATFEAVPGERYLIRVESRYPEPTEFVLLRGSAGDQIEDAIELGTDDPGWRATLPLALLSTQPGEPWSGAPEFSGVGWVHWRPEISGRYRLKSDVRPAIFRGTRREDRQPVELPQTDLGYMVDTGPGEEFWFAFPTRPTGWDATLSIRIEKPPAADAFDSALEAVTGATTDLPEIVGTAEAGEHPHAGRPARASQWYRWSCVRTGCYTLVLSGPQGPRAAVYVGSSLATLNPMLELSPSSEAPVTGTWDAAAGETYHLAFEPGTISDPGLRWRILQSGTEELLETAPRIVAASYRFESGVAEREPLDDQIATPEGLGSKWYRFVTDAQSRGSLLRVTLESEAEWNGWGSPMIRLFQPSISGGLALRGRSASLRESGPLVAQFPVESETEYFIQVCFPMDRPFFAKVGVIQIHTTFPMNAPRLDALDDRLRLTGPYGAVVRLEFSRDLKRWQPTGNALCQTPFLDLELPRSGDAPIYYRIVAD